MSSNSTGYTPVIAANDVNHHDAVKYNRRWVFADDKNQGITNNQKLSELKVDIKFGYLVLQAPGMMRLDIPLDVIEDDDDFDTISLDNKQLSVVDEGDVAAVWASTFLEQEARIFKIYPLDQKY